MTKHRTDRKVKVRVRVAVVNLCFCCSNFSAGAGGAVFRRTKTICAERLVDISVDEEKIAKRLNNLRVDKSICILTVPGQNHQKSHH